MATELVPVRLAVPLIPEVEFASRGKVRFRSAHTPRVVWDHAAAKAMEISQRHRRLYEDGDFGAVVRLLELNLLFITERWIQEALIWLVERNLLKITADGRIRLSGRGRPHGSRRVSDAVVVSLVEAFSSKLGSKMEAFTYAGQRLGLSFDHIRRSYRQIIRDGRLEPLLFEVGPAVPDDRAPVSATAPGTQIHQSIATPLGPAEVTLSIGGESHERQGGRPPASWYCPICSRSGPGSPNRCPNCGAQIVPR